MAYAPILQGQRGIETAQAIASGFLIAIAGVIAYSNAIEIPFHREAESLIVTNDALHGLATLPQAQEPGIPRPLATLTFAVNWWLGPGNPVGFHAVNLFLHLAAGVLVFFVARKLFAGRVRDPMAMLAGLLFVMHPVNTEAVNDIVSRSVILATAFSLVSVLFYVRATASESESRRGALGASLACYALAWASEQTALVLPVLVLAVDRVVNRNRERRYAANAYFWALGIAFLGVRCVTGGVSLDGVQNGAATVVRMLPRYGELTLLWLRPTVDHAEGPAAVWSAALFACVSAVVLLILLRRRSVLGLAWAWFLIGIAASIVLGPSGPVLSEHRLYFALAGLALVIPWVFVVLPTESAARTARLGAGVGFAVLVLVAGVAAFARNSDWRDELALWSDAAGKAPESAGPPAYLGKVFRGIGEAALQRGAQFAASGDANASARGREGAQEAFRKAEENLVNAQSLEPKNAEVLFHLGVVRDYLDNRGQALDDLMEALQLDPENAPCAMRIASLLQMRGNASGNLDDVRRAGDYYKRADRLGKLPAPALLPYGMALASYGNLEAADGILRRAAAAEKKLSEGEWAAERSPAMRTLADVQSALAAARRLEQESNALLAKDSQNPEGAAKFAQALLIEKELLRAFYVLEKSMTKHPQDAATWALLGYVRARMGAAEQFLKEWPQCPAGDQGAAETWKRLVDSCARDGLWPQAETYLNAAGLRGEFPRPLAALGKLAVQLRDGERAKDFFQRATQADAVDPTPWLGLCDLALAEKDLAGAKRVLDEAEKRGATSDEIAARQNRLSEAAKQAPPGTVGTVLR